MLATRPEPAQASRGMDQSDDETRPAAPGVKARRKAERAARLEQALRDNLRRRKAQARGRAEAGGADSPEPGRPADKNSDG
jgi:hypothetical protein